MDAVHNFSHCSKQTKAVKLDEEETEIFIRLGTSAKFAYEIITTQGVWGYKQVRGEMSLVTSSHVLICSAYSADPNCQMT